MNRETILGLALAVTIAACGSEPGEDDSAAADAVAESEDAAQTGSAGTDIADTAAAAGQPAAETGTAPAGVAPALPGDRKARLRNWVLLEFVEPVQEADLQWLRESGFVVDTVMGEKLVRGWLKMPAGGEIISTDPRIARVSAQAR
ncbi:MAG: hypothetical protein GWN99_10560 [Gemmatimonadetes bacterium]|uniref:Uncharacterized protein n=1 Tax=Candidatus Kutchimonas denitrificans TaxID=3056748 RepID=A0AAE4Z939_9BACT|nr:hypothetical protein [Gemmatimonadota bacterium]NIR74737.1 hypothetical protein [Candidatus Kutchimonas denitrificans]NIS01487.1 hypothetical protein [Gemmatimonadota bacterium]NIT67228.1 hypothetical protein [Gemmatimonadota bacterium]NIU52402.1 hypothetical protein [Gemmatimonadota bacterium]